MKKINLLIKNSLTPKKKSNLAIWAYCIGEINAFFDKKFEINWFLKNNIIFVKSNCIELKILIFINKKLIIEKINEWIKKFWYNIKIIDLIYKLWKNKL